MSKETAERTWRVIKSGIRGLNRFLAPLAGLSMLAASCNTPVELSQLSHYSYTPKPSSENSAPFDYCKTIDESSSAVEQTLAGRNIPKREILKAPPKTADGLDDIDLQNITRASFVRNRISDSTRLQAVLVPVGYKKSEVDPHMEYIEEMLRKAYMGVNVEFSHLEDPVSLGISAVSQLATFNDVGSANRIIEKVQKIHPVSKLLFVINTQEYIGSCCPVILSGHNFRTGYIAIHELAHDLGLADGHRISYPSGYVNNEELFARRELLSPAVRRAADKVNAPTISTGNVCRDETVHTFFNPDSNIMIGYIPNDVQLKEDSKKRGIFHPLQKALMHQDIENKFENAKND